MQVWGNTKLNCFEKLPADVLGHGGMRWQRDHTLTSLEFTEAGVSSVLSNGEVQALFQQVLDQGIYSFSASIDDKGIAYPDLARLFPTLTKEEVESFVEKLRNAGIFETKLLDKVGACPDCGSTKSYPKHNCPRCSSFDVGRVLIIEHTRCGYIGSEESFRRGDDIVCPKCKGQLKDVDFKKIGESFECNTCSSRFEAPKVSNKCSSCGQVFTYKDAKYVSIYSYALSETAKRMLVKDFIQIASVANYLRSRGFDVSRNQDLVGRSGATHSFHIVARRDHLLIVADFAFEPKEDKIVALFARKYDISPTRALLITIAEPTEEQEKISAVYGVNIISLRRGRPSMARIIDGLIDDGRVDSKQDYRESPSQGQALEAYDFNVGVDSPREEDYIDGEESEQLEL